METNYEHKVVIISRDFDNKYKLNAIAIFIQHYFPANWVHKL